MPCEPDLLLTRSPDLELFTDASGSLGYGHWMSEPWIPVLQDRSIQWKELYPIALSGLLWDHQWSGKKLLFHCDNQAVVDIWASGTSRDPLLMHLVRSIFFTAATNHFTVLVSHIAGTNKSIADSVSPACPRSRFGTYPCSQDSGDPLACQLAFVQSQALVESTRRSYLAGVRHYTAFC